MLFNRAVCAFAWIEAGKSRKRIEGWPKTQLDQMKECLSLYHDGTCFVNMDRFCRAGGPVRGSWPIMPFFGRTSSRK